MNGPRPAGTDGGAMWSNPPRRLLLLLLSLAPLLAACEGPDSDPLASGGGGAGGSSTTSSTTSTFSTSTSTSTSQGGTGGDTGWGGGGFMDANLAAHAGEDADVFRGDKWGFGGWYTAAPDTNDIEVLWEQISGEPVDLQGVDSLWASFVAPANLGPLVFRLHVRGEWGWGTPDDITIHVIDRPPTVSAGPDIGAPGGTAVTLVGSATDEDDPVLTYTWTQVSGPDVPLTGADTLTAKLTLPAGLTEPLVYALTANDGLVTSDPDWVTVLRVEGADTDGDLLEDAAEAQLGTDPASQDTDADGIPDGWEALGHEQVDYPALGCDPLHRDLLVELDYQEYTDSDGNVHTSHPSPAVQSALQSFYAGLPVENPDGIPGIDLRIVDDTVLGADFRCVYGGPFPTWADTSPTNFLYREAFHHVQICAQPDVAGFAEIGGNKFTMAFEELDADPDNDLQEPAAFYLYAIFLHEMGHNFDLHHGGDEDLNEKPIYPSLMNYAYDFSLSGSPQTIAETQIAFSSGAVPPVNECGVVEKGIFAGVDPAKLTFLASYQGNGWTADGEGSVDWNRDGALSEVPYSLVLRGQPGIGDPGPCLALHDHDDLAVIAKRMGYGLPSSPAVAAAGFRSRKRRVLAP